MSPESKIFVPLFLMFSGALQSGWGADAAPSREKPLTVGGVPVAQILMRLGAKLEKGLSPAQVVDYSRHFDLVDTDGDGRHSKVEYIEKGGVP